MAWLKRSSTKGNKNEELFDQMAQAFINHKKETNRRLENIEAMITQDDEFSAEPDKATHPYQRIEIDPTPGNKTPDKEEHSRANKNRVK